MIWAITGGSGQLGRSLAEKLAKEGEEFQALGRKDLDISKQDSIEEIISLQPTILINCAAWTDVEQAELNFLQAKATNQAGARNMALAAKYLKIPLVHLSTDYVFSGFSDHAWTVNDVPEPRSRYGQSKLLGEREVQSIYPEGSTILRTAWLYGPYGTNFVKKIITKAISTDQPIRVVDDQKGQPTSSFDLATQIWEFVELGLRPGIFHATNAGKTSWWDFACQVVRLLGQPTDRVIAVPSSSYSSLVDRPYFSVLDHSEWSKVKMKPMRSWLSALEDIFPRILKSVEGELGSV